MAYETLNSTGGIEPRESAGGDRGDARQALREESHAEGKATAVSSVINLVNTIVGAGILAMPYAYRANGVLLGTLIILASGMASGFGLYMQALSSKFVPRGHASFFALSKITYPGLAVIFDMAIAIKCFGVGVSYLIIFGDLMPQVVEAVGLASSSDALIASRKLWLTIAMGIVGPLSFLKRLDSLKYTSIIALISVGYLVVLVVAHFFVGDVPDSKRGDVRLLAPYSLPAVLQTLSIVVFAFTCHQNMFSVLNELKKPTERKLKGIIATSIGNSAFLYVVVGLCGYFTFGDTVGGNIITTYPYSIFSTIGRFAIVILVVFSYPLQCHPCRASLNHVMQYFTHKPEHHHNVRDNNDTQLDPSVFSDDGCEVERRPLFEDWAATSSVAESVNGDGPQNGGNDIESQRRLQEQEQRKSKHKYHMMTHIEPKRFIILTIIILVLSYLLALSVESLELMLAFVGSTGSTSISFILPGIFGYTLLAKSRVGAAEVPIKHAGLLRSMSLVLFTWGIVVMVTCLGTNLWMLGK